MKTITRLDIVFCAVSERIADYVSRAVKITVHVALWAATVALALAIFDGFVFVALAGADWLAKHGPNLSGLFGPGGLLDWIAVIFWSIVLAFFAGCVVWGLIARLIEQLRGKSS
jgi:hypothetical protein